MARPTIPWEERLADIPTERDDIRDRVWQLLKARLAQRRRLTPELGTRVDFGPPDQVNEQGQTRGPIPRDADLVMGLNCSELAADLAGIWPDLIPPNVREVAYPRLLDEIYELVRVGVLRPDPGNSTRAMMITQHGAASLDADDRDLPPHSAERVQQLRDRFADAPQLDLLARHYGEAISTYADGHDLSATVMVGACYELGFRQAAESLADYEQRTGQQAPRPTGNHLAHLQRVRDNEYVPAGIISDLVHDILVNGFGRDLDEEDRKWARTCLQPNGFFIRSLRNAAGHPSGDPVTHDEVATYIMLFPGFYGRVRSIVTTLDGLP